MDARKLTAVTAALIALAVPAAATAAPGPWTDKNNADATICSTYGRDGTQAVVKPQPGVDTTCMKPGSSDTDPPTVSTTTPANGSVYTVGQSVTASFSCSDLQGIALCEGEQCPVVNGAIDLANCVAVLNGGQIDTSAAGDFAFGVQATDTGGNTTSHWTFFTVADGNNGADGSGSNLSSGSDTGSNDGGVLASGTDTNGSSTNGSGTNGSGSASNSGSLGNAAAGDQLLLGARLAGCNVVLAVSHKQRSFRSKGLLLRVRSSRTCTVKMAGKLIPAKRASARKAKARTKTVVLKLKAGKAQTVKLRFTKRGLAYLKRSLKGKITRARIFVSDGGDVGHPLNRSFTIRIKG